MPYRFTAGPCLCRSVTELALLVGAGLEPGKVTSDRYGKPGGGGWRISVVFIQLQFLFLTHSPLTRKLREAKEREPKIIMHAM